MKRRAGTCRRSALRGDAETFQKLSEVEIELLFVHAFSIFALAFGAPSARPAPVAPTTTPFAAALDQLRRGLVLGLRDYVSKNGFSEVVVAVSGGIDSAVTLALCVEALGAERVHAVSMPSRYSSEGTREDAAALARNLEVGFHEIPIETAVEAFG